jgi:TolB-like protein/Flp pilus assembly protein TadD
MRVYSLEVGVPAQAKPATRTRGVWARWPALAAALALVLLAAGAYAWRAGYAPRLPGASVAEDKLKTAPRLSLVVLPFENLGGDPEQQYFADGITDDLTTDLSHVPDSFVIARDTAFTFKGRQVDAKAIGRELGVRYMLEGSVRRAGEKVEINAQLISTETGAHLWADRFEGERSNLGKLQFEVVARLANSLGVELMKAEVLRDERERPGDPDARDLTMRGFATIWNFNGANKATWNDAIAMFERALALDPHNAHAMTGLAIALFTRPYAGWSDDPAADVARAEKTADDALALRPDDSDAHMAKAYIFEAKSQIRAAIAEAETAVADDPNNARAIEHAGYLGSYFGHSEDGVAAVETALRLSPHDPTMPVMQVHLCYLHNNLAQWEQAIEWCEKALANNVKERRNALAALAVANAWAGHDKEAKDAVAELRKVDPAFTVQTIAGWHPSDDPTFKAQFARYLEGLRKAGVPEGDKKTN